MKLGFIGTGQIAKATILGILGSNLKIDRIYSTNSPKYCIFNPSWANH